VEKKLQCFEALRNFPTQFFPKRLVYTTFLAFVLADVEKVPAQEKIGKVLVRTLCVTAAGKKDDDLDYIFNARQLYFGASPLEPLANFRYEDKLPVWSHKCSLIGDAASAWFSLLCVIHEDTLPLLSLGENERATRIKMEKHHLMPVCFLKDQGNTFDKNHINSIYNFMPISAPLNNAISDLSPLQYFPVLSAALSNAEIKLIDKDTEAVQRVAFKGNVLLDALRQIRGNGAQHQPKRTQYLSPAMMQQIAKIPLSHNIATAMHVPTKPDLLQAKKFQEFLQERRRLILLVLQKKF